MPNVCTFVPTYYPKFHFALNFLRTHNKFAKTDLYFGFSTPNEQLMFENLVQKSDEFKEISKHYGYLIIPCIGGRGIINQKKILGVDALSNHYDYIGVFDDETVFVKPFDSSIIYEEIANSKSFKSNLRNDHLTHLKGVADLMLLSENKDLIRETDNFTQYWWFNEICVYETGYFKEFFNWLINHENSVEIMMSFECFDYLLYSMWLIAFKQFKLDKRMHNYSFGAGAVETNYDDDEISHEFASYADRNINHENIEHIKVQIMIDRSEAFLKKLSNKKLV
jgi:hypothetical protein